MLKKIVLKKFNRIPETMIILGSGINSFVNNLNDSESISYKELFNYDTDASIGHSGLLHLGYINKKSILVLEGRKHYYENVSDFDMRQMIQAFASIGVKNIVVTNACGGMNESFKPGDIMVIEDHINMSGRNPLVGLNNNDLGPRFVDMSEPYDLDFREMIDKVALKENIELQHGIYVSYIGPSYETKAEIRAFRMLGGDAVGMSTVPEVIIARQANMRVLGLSLITNMSTGITKNLLSHEEVLEVGKLSVHKLSKLLIGFLERI
ncbi:MAG: purine-nucleoside phosphorylase [Tenericutes bacterium]|nr:purine-nucleoside phosphorylase [Mycoplasmatota bacterium]